jgi:transposase
VIDRGSYLMDLHGVGPVAAARVLAVVGHVTRFADRNRSRPGPAPHRWMRPPVSRTATACRGLANRRMNHMIHIAVISQIRLDTEGRAYYRGKRAEGKKLLEAIRCLKRRISDAIFRQLLADAQRAVGTGPGGHCGATQESSAAGSHPHTGTSDQPLPGPAPRTLPARATARKTPISRPLEPAS